MNFSIPASSSVWFTSARPPSHQYRGPAVVRPRATQSVAALSRIKDRAKDVGGLADVFDRECLEDVSIGSCGIRQSGQILVAVRRMTNRVFEDGWIGRYAAQAISDHRVKLAGSGHSPTEIIQPDALFQV